MSAILGGEGIITDNYGLELFGVKGLYRVNPGGVSPYVGLTVGAARLTTPEVTVNGQVVSEGLSSTGFGLGLEAGIELNGVLIGIDYMLPTKFSFDVAGTTTESGGLGGLIIHLGYRRGFLED